MYSTYLILFLEVGYHDNGGAVKLPNHPPEVRECGWLGALSSNVRIWTIETLWPRERERERERESLGICECTSVCVCEYMSVCVCVCVCETDVWGVLIIAGYLSLVSVCISHRCMMH